jgi:hypothetical protein
MIYPIVKQLTETCNKLPGAIEKMKSVKLEIPGKYKNKSLVDKVGIK